MSTMEMKMMCPAVIIRLPIKRMNHLERVMAITRLEELGYPQLAKDLAEICDAETFGEGVE